MNVIKYLLLLLISQLSFAQWSISYAERSALISLYNTTNGDHWSTGWDFSKDPKSWYGIKIKNGSVIEINLKGNALQGNFPQIFGSFPQLQKLDLSSNLLQGQVSGSVSGLTNLIRLDLSNNRLTGDPTSVFTPLANLTELSIGNNNFNISNVEALLQNFSNLKILDLSHLGLTMLPQKLSSFTQLKSLTLSNNLLTSNFSVLNQLSQLEELDLSGNQIQSIPSETGQLVNLKSLNLAHNNLNTAFAAPLSSLKNLEWLSLEDNQISVIPAEFNQLKKLVHLNLGRNQLSGSMATLIALTNLEQIFLHHNKLSGNFPAELLQLKKLQMLSLSSNQLSGNIPENCPEITFIDNNRYSETDLKTFLQQRPVMADFVYSPQRYDEEKTINAPLNTPVILPQSLSGNDYQFTWYKNLSEDTGIHTSDYHINNVQQEDYGKYTVEAYYLHSFPAFLMEVSFFREPITLQQELGTEELLKELSIYPNPAADYLHIRAKNTRVEEAWIYDLSGKLVLNSRSPLVLNIRHLPSATYLLRLKTDKGYKAFKWIKE